MRSEHGWKHIVAMDMTKPNSLSELFDESAALGKVTYNSTAKVAPEDALAKVKSMDCTRNDDTTTRGCETRSRWMRSGEHVFVPR